MNMKVIYEDPDMLALEKPAGVLVHKDARSGDKPTIAEWLMAHYPEIKGVGDEPETRPGIVHRLDKETSGVLVVARTQRGFDHLKKQFRERAIEKVYLALVRGEVKKDRDVIEKPIGLKSGTTRRTVWTKEAKMVKEAKTEYRVKERFQDFTLLEVRPHTGRTHQIRVHLASIGHPVVGDAIYGKQRALLPRHFLHAASLTLTAPDGKRLTLTADLPSELTSFVATLAPAAHRSGSA